MEKVAEALIKDVEIPDESFINKCTGEDLKRAKLSETIVAMHGQVQSLNDQLQKSAKKFNYTTPRDFIDLVNHFQKL
jgi:dynein heavy chain 1